MTNRRSFLAVIAALSVPQSLVLRADEVIQ